MKKGQKRVKKMGIINEARRAIKAKGLLKLIFRIIIFLVLMGGLAFLTLTYSDKTLPILAMFALIKYLVTD